MTYRVTLEDLQDGLEAVVDVGLDELADVRFLLDVHPEVVILEHLRTNRGPRERR